MSFVSIGGFIVANAGTIALASAAVGVVSSVASADAQRQSAHTNADIARQNAQITQQQATTNEEAQRRRGAILLGRTAAGAAADGGLSGTNLDLYQQNAANAEIDALNVRYQGQLGALSSNTTAGLDDAQANNATTAGYLNAGAAALSAGSNYANAGRRLNQPVS